MLTVSNSGSSSGTAANKSLSETTLQWQSAVTKEAQKQGVPELIPYIMAIIEVETRGLGTDIMQSGESAGLGKNGYSDPLDSIAQGVKYLKNCVLIGEPLGFKDFWGIVQSYNFGSNYVRYLATQNMVHTVDIGMKYSREVVAPSLGNTTKATYSYVNNVSLANGNTFLYSNGGNFFYADLVRQYVSEGGIGNSDIPLGSAQFQIIMEEALKYEGNAYVWGGSTPSTGFDCSGLTQWVFSKAGISITRTALSQWGATDEISISEAKPGDLIFFKGTYGAPDHISHVGIYIDETRMFDSSGSGIGFHYWSTGYWFSHFESIHRVRK